MLYSVPRLTTYGCSASRRSSLTDANISPQGATYHAMTGASTKLITITIGGRTSGILGSAWYRKNRRRTNSEQDLLIECQGGSAPRVRGTVSQTQRYVADYSATIWVRTARQSG